MIRLSVLVPAVALSFAFSTICPAQELDIDRSDYLSGFGQSSDFSPLGKPGAPKPGKPSSQDEPSRDGLEEGASGTRLGLLEFERDGRVCLDVSEGSGDCDLFIKNKGLHLKLTEDGSQFPIYLGLEGQ